MGRVIVIGASSGGPDAVVDLLRALGLPDLPVLVVLHLPPGFVRPYARTLESRAGVPVAVAEHGEVVARRTIRLAPGDHHLEPRRGDGYVRYELNRGPAVNYCRPSVDVTLRAAVCIWGGGVAAAILSGVGRDGAQGCEAVHRAGGPIWIQDEASAVSWGMPRGVLARGIARPALPPAAIGEELARWSESETREPPSP